MRYNTFLTQHRKQTMQATTHTEDGVTTTTYTGDELVTLAHDSIWDCIITEADEVRINTISVIEEDYKSIAVFYTVNGVEYADESWRVYTDSGFEAAVSALLGYDVMFTEQGMQEDGIASME
jgi:hypothetical protein